MKFVIHLDEEQIKVMIQALETRFRIEMKQFGIVENICGIEFETTQKTAKYKSISDLSMEAKIALDLFQAMRYKLAWSKEQNTPQKRDWKRQMQTMYDEPLPVSGKSFPKIEVISD